MKVIIAGSRSITDPDEIEKATQFSGFDITEVVSGACPRGVDRIGEEWAKRHGIPIRRFPAQWNAFGPLAGPMRNGVMADYADALIAVWDGDSPGTRNMIARAGEKGVPTIIWRVLKEIQRCP